MVNEVRVYRSKLPSQPGPHPITPADVFDFAPLREAQAPLEIPSS
jgi:hypothetical protein